MVLGDILTDRRRALEEEFFGRQNRELIERLRTAERTHERKVALREASGLQSEELLDELVALDIGSDTLAALRVVPLVHVAWADGEMSAEERDSILGGAESVGLDRGGPAYGLLAAWLDAEPPATLFESWRAYVAALQEHHGRDEAQALRRAALDGAWSVARATGGTFGLGSISPAENAAIEEIEQAFAVPSRDRKPGPVRIETIIAGTDFSANADTAMRWAANLARRHEAQLVLVYALLPAAFTAHSHEFVPMPPELYELQRNHVQKGLTERAEALRRDGVEVITELRMGPAPYAIADAIRGWDADLVVVGTRGETGLGRVFLGSTAARVVRESSCAVVTIHATQDLTDRPVLRILLPTDFSEDASRAAAEAERVLGPIRDGAAVTLLHAYRLPGSPVTTWSTELANQVGAEVEAEARGRLEEIAEPLRARGLEVDVRVIQGDPAVVIDAEAERIGADLIAMGTYGRSGVGRLFLGSIAERVLPEAPCPVLTVRPLPGPTG